MSNELNPKKYGDILQYRQTLVYRKIGKGIRQQCGKTPFFRFAAGISQYNRFFTAKFVEHEEFL